MKFIIKINILLVLITSITTNINSQTTFSHNQKIDSLSNYLEKGYIIKDSLVIHYNKNSEALILSLIDSIGEARGRKNINEKPIKRLFLMYCINNGSYYPLIKNFNVFPALSFGERSDVGYYHLIQQKDMFSFNVSILPNSNNNEYDIKYNFSYYPEKKEWFFSNCTIEKYNNDEIIKCYYLDKKNFGDIKLADFNIYEFNPFVYL